jgi:large subunit ribosomal protein L13
MAENSQIKINASGKILGRLASRVAYILQGKDKPGYRPEVRDGSYVIVYNTDKFELSGKKAEQGVRIRHSGYPGGLKAIPVRKTMERDSRVLVKHAVMGMLAKNRLRAKIIKRLTLVKGDLSN